MCYRVMDCFAKSKLNDAMQCQQVQARLLFRFVVSEENFMLRLESKRLTTETSSLCSLFDYLVRFMKKQHKGPTQKLSIRETLLR